MPKKICTECIAEDYLNKYIITNGKLTRCSFCKKQNPAINFSDLSTLVREALENHYERTATQPSDFEILVQNEFKQEWERSGSLTIDILTDEFGISEEPAKEILAEIEEKDKLNYEYDSGEDFDDQVHYIKKRLTLKNGAKTGKNLSRSCKQNQGSLIKRLRPF
ncbi:hypothetical protein CMU70_18560 [Elizabethkingia anophelis]|nr:hypothetical protein [Elizabethkingia anophelis]